MAHSFPKGLHSFYIKLYKIVDDPSLDPIIKWSESNNSFIVLDVKEFCREILSKSVGLGRNYTRFIIELEYHGFKRLIGNGQLDEYGHDDFVRGQPQLLKKMMLQACTERMERIAPTLEARKARAKARRARHKSRKASAEVEDLVHNLQI